MNSTSISDSTPDNIDASMSVTDQNIRIKDFDWIDFPVIFEEIGYLDTFLKEKANETLDYVVLDIEDFHIDGGKERNTTMNDIIKDQYLRILKYGNISSFQSKEKKTPEKLKNQEAEYDLDDSFIDDSEMDQGLIKMEVYQGQFNDYFCFEGGLNALLNTEHYKNRLNDLENIRKFTLEDKKIYMKKAKKPSKRNKKKANNLPKDKKTPSKKSFKVLEVSSGDEDDKKHGLLNFDNLRPEEEKKNKSQTSSIVEVIVDMNLNDAKNSVKKKENVKKSQSKSKRKRDSMAKKEEIFTANHPTLGKFKVSKNKK